MVGRLLVNHSPDGPLVMRTFSTVFFEVHAAKLTEADIPVIWARRQAGETYTSIGRSCDVSHNAIREAVIGLSWAQTYHLVNNLSLPPVIIRLPWKRGGC